MSKTLRVMLAAVFCIIFAQSVLAAGVMTNTPMGNQMMYTSRSHYYVTPTNISTQRYLGTGSATKALADMERQRAYDKAPLKETLYAKILAAHTARRTVNRGFRVYQWGVSVAPTYGNIPTPKPAVATANGNVTAQVFPTQNAMNPNP
jgi:hypothetical protein